MSVTRLWESERAIVSLVWLSLNQATPERPYLLGCGQRSPPLQMTEGLTAGVRPQAAEGAIRQSVSVCFLCIWCWAWRQQFWQTEKWQETADKPVLSQSLHIRYAEHLLDELGSFLLEMRMHLGWDWSSWRNWGPAAATCQLGDNMHELNSMNLQSIKIKGYYVTSAFSISCKFLVWLP